MCRPYFWMSIIPSQHGKRVVTIDYPNLYIVIIGHFRVLPCQCLFRGLITVASSCLRIVTLGLSSFV